MPNKAMRRRDMEAAKPVPSAVTRGPLTLDVIAARAFFNGEDMLLARKEFALLLLLAQSEGKMLSKETLYETVWKAPMAGDGGAFWKQMSTLKKKLDKYSGAVSLTASRGGDGGGYILEIVG